MKKITLAIVTVLMSVGAAFSQATILVTAPAGNAQTGYRLPDATFEHKELRGVCLIKQSELTSLTANIVNAIQLTRLNGATGITSTGTFSLWLINTGDASYTKSTTFATAISGMTQYYSGPLTIPQTTAAGVHTFPLSPSFNYTGGGIYVAWAWNETSPAVNTSTAQVIWVANNAGSGNNLCASAYSSVSPAPTMTLGDFRPAFTFSAVNTATNEVGLLDLTGVLRIAKVANTHSWTAVIRNNSIGTLSNITVTLGVSGANTFVDTKTVSSLAGGATATVVFNAFSPTTLGINTVVAVLSADQNTVNNGLGVTQSVTCAETAIGPAFTPTVYAQDGLGSTSSARIFSFKYTPVANIDLAGVSLVIPSIAAAGNLSKTIFPVVLDATGNIVTQGPNFVVGSNNMDIYQTVPFTSGSYPTLAAGTTYYIGIGMGATGYYPCGIYDPGYFVDNFYSSPATGGSAPVLIDFGYLSLGAVFSNTALAITAQTTKTFMCVGETNTISVTGTAGTTYTWTSPVPTASNTATMVILSPTLSAATASTQVNYSVTGTNGGCKTNTATVSVKVSKCTGINELQNANGIEMYPNPARTTAIISGLEGKNTITVINAIGQIVHSETTDASTVNLNIAQMPVGTYLVRITDQSSGVKMMKLIKQD